jgi:hypothetical protein
MMKDRQRARGRNRLAAARKSRSVHVIAGTAGSPEDGEFVPKHDDFQVFEVVRSNAQDSELKNPPKNDVTEREEHEPSRAARKPLLSYASASGINVGFCQTELRDRIYAPYTARRRDRLGGLVHE